MKKLFLVGLMMLAGPAWAEWVRYSKNDTNTFYYDPATIRKEGNVRRVWVINDLRTRHKDGEMSRRARYEFDCKQERLRILGVTEHSEPMAGGVILTTGVEGKDWTDVPPDTNADFLLKIVCAK